MFVHDGLPTSLSLSLSLSCSLSLSFSLSPPLSALGHHIIDYQYLYTLQLMSVEACSKDQLVPQYMCKVVIPLKLQAWQDALSTYPDKNFAAYILWGIESGFKIGFDPELVRLRSQTQNMCSALEQPEVVDKYIHDELQADQVV